MPDLNAQLREYFDATAPPLEVGEVVGDEVLVPGGRRTPSRRWTAPGWAYGLATMVVVLVLILGLALLLPGGNEDDVVEPTPTTVVPDPETMSDLEVIEAGVAALYSGDAERAAELFQLTGVGTDDQIRAEAAYQAAIGGRLTLSCTEATSTPGAFNCAAPYHNAATDAIGFVGGRENIDVVVEDGVITEFGVFPEVTEFNFPVHSWMLIQFGVFLAIEGRLEGYEDCEIGPFPESCATIQMENLDGWVEWRENMDGTKVVEAALNAWYGGDCPTARWLSGTLFDCSTSSVPTQTIEYESILGAQVSVDCEAPPYTGTLSCEVQYSSAMNSAVGEPPSVTVRDFIVDDEYPIVGDARQDLSPWYGGIYPEDTELRESFRLFAEGGDLQDEYADANCASERTPECANLILDNVDEWAASYETNR